MPFTITVQINANAFRNAVVGWLGEKLKIKVKAPAVEGKANAELLRYLAEILDVRVNTIRISRGETSKTKLIEIDGLTREEFDRKLDEPNP